MHMEYEVRLPDHDCVVTAGHKLIPSVYAVCEIKSAAKRSPSVISHTGPVVLCTLPFVVQSMNLVLQIRMDEISIIFMKSTKLHLLLKLMVKSNL